MGDPDFVQHPDEPAYTDREKELARSDEREGELTGDPSAERSVVRRELADVDREAAASERKQRGQATDQGPQGRSAAGRQQNG